MNPQITSILAVLFVSIGAITVFIMLDMVGRVKDRTDKKKWMTVHRLLGYLFIALFGLLLIIMVSKTAGIQEELSARAVFHIVLALLLLALLVIKVVIARRHSHLGSHLPMLGVTIFCLAFALTGITAGYYVLHRDNLSYTTLSAMDDNILDLELGKAIMNRKCSKCHSLERVYRAYKSKEGWAATVNEMARMDAPNITSFDVKQTLNYLVLQQEKRQIADHKEAEKEIGKTLVSRKCTVCHDLERVFAADKKKEAWAATVERMAATMGDPDFLSSREQADIVNFLSEKNSHEEATP